MGRGSGTPRASARAVALEVVRRVTDEDAYSNRLLPALLDRSGLSARDRSLASELAYGTLRYLLRVDAATAPYLKRPLSEAPPAARAALRLGTHQVLHMRIPPHAAVGETVALVPEGERGFCNAVLRKVASRGFAPPEGRDDRAVALRTGLQPWAVGELRSLVGSAVEEAARAIASRAGLAIRTNPCLTSPKELESELRASGHDPLRGTLHEGTFRLEGGAPRSLPGWDRGWFAVQDEASSYVVDVLGPRPGERVADVAAGPGGKAADIACRSGTVVAGDVSETRVRLVGESAGRLATRALLIVQDGAVPALRPVFDRVLLDAPCTGIGSARRRPELLWRPRKSSLSGLARLQVRLAVGAASLLRPGGVLVYSVCTFPRAETDAACDALLGKAPWLRPDPFVGPGGRVEERVRLWPHLHGTDAMFVARFRREGP